MFSIHVLQHNYVAFSCRVHTRTATQRVSLTNNFSNMTKKIRVTKTAGNLSWLLTSWIYTGETTAITHEKHQCLQNSDKCCWFLTTLIKENSKKKKRKQNDPIWNIYEIHDFKYKYMYMRITYIHRPPLQFKGLETSWSKLHACFGRDVIAGRFHWWQMKGLHSERMSLRSEGHTCVIAADAYYGFLKKYITRLCAVGTEAVTSCFVNIMEHI